MNPTRPLAQLLIALSLVLLPAPGHADEKTDQAVRASEAWLALVDSGDYARSWQEAAPFFKERVPEADWAKMVGQARGPFGDLKSRELKSAVYSTTLRGAPDGEYVVIQFRTSFDKKASAVETVTPMKDNAGEWKVSGYYVK